MFNRQRISDLEDHVAYLDKRVSALIDTIIATPEAQPTSFVFPEPELTVRRWLTAVLPTDSDTRVASLRPAFNKVFPGYTNAALDVTLNKMRERGEVSRVGHGTYRKVA